MNKFIPKFILGCLATATAIGLSTIAIAQDGMIAPPAKPAPTAKPHRGEPSPKPSPKDSSFKFETPPLPPENWMYRGDTYERSIAVAPNVNVTLCVIQGDLRINGWNRNEVRVFIKDGSRISFKVREKSTKDDKPIWISPIGYDPKKVDKNFPDCIWGETIEIDVPMNSSVEIKGQETGAIVDSIKSIWIKNVGGDISIRNISNSTTALTYEGDVTVESCEGPVNLETTSGNITAFEVSAKEISDRFRAKTSSGTISLLGVGHRQTEATSISGSIFFTGDIRPGGLYGLGTSNGSIRMTVPAKSAFQLWATYGYGSFTNELPFKIDTETIQPGPIKKVSGKVNNGSDATVKLSTNNGSIAIKKS